jgi:hypothetical protein
MGPDTRQLAFCGHYIQTIADGTRAGLLSDVRTGLGFSVQPQYSTSGLLESLTQLQGYLKEVLSERRTQPTRQHSYSIRVGSVEPFLRPVCPKRTRLLLARSPHPPAGVCPLTNRWASTVRRYAR